jgi:basic membrane lipoprotein Med (substrate-binding protein (PBP1-ABC) superfamily)
MFKSHPNSKKAPEVSLDAEETGRGHTIERHVITSMQAKRRVVNEGQIPSSIWSSKSKANEATNSIISKNWHSIKEWANTQGEGQYPNELIEDNTQGKVFWEDLEERDSERARLFLHRTKPAPGNVEVEVRVVTAYPEHASKPSDVGPAKKGNIKKTDKW